jgi:hypothetical protein
MVNVKDSDIAKLDQYVVAGQGVQK